MGSKVKSAATVADRLIVFHAGIHAAFMLAEKDHYCPIVEALDYIAKLESAASPTASVEKVEARMKGLRSDVVGLTAEAWIAETDRAAEVIATIIKTGIEP